MLIKNIHLDTNCPATATFRSHLFFCSLILCIIPPIHPFIIHTYKHPYIDQCSCYRTNARSYVKGVIHHWQDALEMWKEKIIGAYISFITEIIFVVESWSIRRSVHEEEEEEFFFFFFEPSKVWSTHCNILKFHWKKYCACFFISVLLKAPHK